MPKFIYETTRPVVDRIAFQDAFTGAAHHVTEISRSPGRFVFNGRKRDFLAKLDAMNAAHGAGYAVPCEK